MSTCFMFSQADHNSFSSSAQQRPPGPNPGPDERSSADDCSGAGGRITGPAAEGAAWLVVVAVGVVIVVVGRALGYHVGRGSEI